MEQHEHALGTVCNLVRLAVKNDAATQKKLGGIGELSPPVSVGLDEAGKALNVRFVEGSRGMAVMCTLDLVTKRLRVALVDEQQQKEVAVHHTFAAHHTVPVTFDKADYDVERKQAHLVVVRSKGGSQLFDIGVEGGKFTRVKCTAAGRKKGLLTARQLPRFQRAYNRGMARHMTGFYGIPSAVYGGAGGDDDFDDDDGGGDTDDDDDSEWKREAEYARLKCNFDAMVVKVRCPPVYLVRVGRGSRLEEYTEPRFRRAFADYGSAGFLARWLRDPAKRVFQTMEFSEAVAPPEVLNLWTGFEGGAPPYPPYPPSPPPLGGLRGAPPALLERVAGPRAPELEGWLADLVQNPCQRARRRRLVLCGPDHATKRRFLELLAAMVGERYVARSPAEVHHLQTLLEFQDLDAEQPHGTQAADVARREVPCTHRRVIMCTTSSARNFAGFSGSVLAVMGDQRPDDGDDGTEDVTTGALLGHLLHSSAAPGAAAAVVVTAEAPAPIGASAKAARASRATRRDAAVRRYLLAGCPNLGDGSGTVTDVQSSALCRTYNDWAVDSDRMDRGVFGKRVARLMEREGIAGVTKRIRDGKTLFSIRRPDADASL